MHNKGAQAGEAEKGSSNNGGIGGSEISRR